MGSGTGNDVAAALRHDSPSIDAVEIDPFILEIGKTEHPERPYDSSRVSVHLTDARAFMKRTPLHYDLVLFGLLDSHTQLSDYANMRIDNFVYTEESFQEAKSHLKPDGVLFVKFEVRHRWMARRIEEMLTSTFGKEPVVFNADSSYTARARCFAISSSNRVQDALKLDPQLAEFVARNPVESEAGLVPVTTDDWPYLYQRDKTIPRPYWSISAIIMVLTLGLYWTNVREKPRKSSLFFFCMGAGFLLLETQVISRLALFFGDNLAGEWDCDFGDAGGALAGECHRGAQQAGDLAGWEFCRIAGRPGAGVLVSVRADRGIFCDCRFGSGGGVLYSGGVCRDFVCNTVSQCGVAECGFGGESVGSCSRWVNGEPFPGIRDASFVADCDGGLCRCRYSAVAANQGSENRIGSRFRAALR